MYDIVYFCKDSPKNEELRYSLRSVEKNFPHEKIWIYGGKPDYIIPDKYVPMVQCQVTKWANVKMLLLSACENDNITEDFYLFNDDFFVMHPVEQVLPPFYDGTLAERIIEIENRSNYTATSYTRQLRQLLSLLISLNCGRLNYAVHMPMLINRKKALDVLNEFPETPMFRALYGNYYNLGGEERKDTKYFTFKKEPDKEVQFISTTDICFNVGLAGEYIRESFPEPCKYEKEAHNE